MADIGSSVTGDYFALDDLLTEEERDMRDRAFSDREVIPIVNGYREKEEFPFELLPTGFLLKGGA